MKMAGGALTPCIRTDLGETLPFKIRRPVGKQTATCRDLFGAATCPVQNDVMNVYRHMDVSSPNNEDGRGSFDPMHQNRPRRELFHKIRRPVGKHTVTCRDLFGAATCPVQNDVMNVYRHMVVWSPNNEDGRGSFDPMHQNRPWRDAPAQNQTACGKANSHMQELCLGQRHAQCRMM